MTGHSSFSLSSISPVFCLITLPFLGQGGMEGGDTQLWDPKLVPLMQIALVRSYCLHGLAV